MKNILSTLSGTLNNSKLILMGGLGVTFFSGCINSNEKTETPKPNIVLILADDLGYGDLSCYGATKLQTPEIDKLASEGMSFNNAYVSSSLCSPSRYSLMTGQYSWRSRLKFGVLKYFDKPLIKEDQTSIADLLKRNGYYTACVGKWHLGLEWEVNENAPENPDKNVFDSWDDHVQDYIDFSKTVDEGPLERGFDYFYGMTGSNNMQPYVFIENNKVTLPPSEPQKAYDHYINVDKAPNWDIKTVNQTLTHKAVEVINDHFSKESGKPLFLYFPTSAIHRPCLPTFTKGKSRAGLRGDIVMELDWTVSEVVKALKENGVYENTLLIFTSDNGPRPGDPALWMKNYEDGDYEDYHQEYYDDYSPEYVNENGNPIWKEGWFTYGHGAAGNLLGFKSDAWEGAFRVPFIVRWPGKVKPGTNNDNLICLTDVLATFADIMDDSLANDQGEDSYSFLPAILDKDAPQARTSLTISGGASGAMVEIAGGWKFIEAAVPGRWPETYYPNGPSKLEPQLYNLKEDEEEKHNLYEENPEKVKELKEIIVQVQNHPKSEASEKSTVSK